MPDNRLWLAVDDTADPAVPIETIEATFAGFISVELEPASDNSLALTD